MMKKLLLSLLALCTLSSLHAEVSLPSIMASDMVLQQKQPVPIWGWADPGEVVTVKFAGQSKTATADKSGKFMVQQAEGLSLCLLSPSVCSQENRRTPIHALLAEYLAFCEVLDSQKTRSKWHGKNL